MRARLPRFGRARAVPAGAVCGQRAAVDRTVADAAERRLGAYQQLSLRETLRAGFVQHREQFLERRALFVVRFLQKGRLR